MNRRKFVGSATVAATAAIAGAAVVSCKNDDVQGLQSGELLHTVSFNLKYAADAAETQQFISDGIRILSAIPVVHNFQAFRQTSPKCVHAFGFSMVFKNRTDFETYCNHPDHTNFVANRWDKEVTEFQETDYESL